VTPYFFIKYWNNMYLAILWCLQYVCRNLFSRNMVQWTWGAFSTFPKFFNRVPDSARYQRWRQILVLVHVNCMGPYVLKNVYFGKPNFNPFPQVFNGRQPN
jgi:hypothetical protein